MKIKIFKLAFALMVALFAVNAQASSCSFTRDLSVGSRGEDVRCLQQYLNTAGSSVYLFPDGSFGPVTRQAVMTWQVQNALPATGYFDAISRGVYFDITGSFGGPGTVLGYSFDTLTVTSGGEQARAAIQDALVALEDAKDEANTFSERESLEDGEEAMLASMRAFFISKNFSQAYNLALQARSYAEDALGQTRNDDEEEDIQDLIDEVDEDIDDTQDEINEAEDNGQDVDEANEILDDAREALDDAEDALDDRDYDEAEDMVREAEDLVDDALDEIDETDNDTTWQEARDAIEDAEDAIDDAQDEIDDAEDDGQDVNEAEDLLNEAEDKLDDAQDELNDGDYDRARDLAEDAEDLADDAVDELN